jgi:hypothetical protein
LFHDLSDLLVKLMDQGPGCMVDDLVEALKTDTTLTDVSVEESDTNDDVR